LGKSTPPERRDTRRAHALAAPGVLLRARYRRGAIFKVLPFKPTKQVSSEKLNYYGRAKAALARHFTLKDTHEARR
jgi:hypothetical protein